MRNLFTAVVLLASSLVLVSCDSDRSSPSFRAAQKKLSPGAQRAFNIAKTISDDMGLEVFEVCVTDGSFGDFPESLSPPDGGVSAFNIAIGGCDFDTETCDCDPHFSIDVFLDSDDNFVLAHLVDA